jgi:hypothetical protein
MRNRSWSSRLGASELVWHRANTEAELSACLESGVRWIECDARADQFGVVRVGHEPLEGETAQMELSDWLGVVKGASRSAKIDLKEGGLVLPGALDAVARVGLSDEDLWFNAVIEVPDGGDGFTRLAQVHRGARISCPLDTLAPYLLFATPAYEIVEFLRAVGVNWLCFGACVPGIDVLIPGMQERGWPVNVWDVEDADDLERASSLRPEAITADLGSI